MKLRVKIERIDPLQEGTSKQGFAYARRNVAVSCSEQLPQSTTLRHTFICDTTGDFARNFEDYVKPGMETVAELRFYVETYNFRDYQRVRLESVDVETA